jgi:hypothetical protein
MPSTTVEYSITILIGFLVLSGAASTLSGVVDDRDERVTEEHLEHVGTQISTIMTHHSEAEDTHNTHNGAMSSVGVSSSTTYSSSTVVDEPPEINGERYTVQVDSDGEELILEAADVGVTATVPLNDNVNADPLSGGVGGRLVVVYNETSDQVRLDTEQLEL